ncbi:MAG: F0F1 ATP synthase subunit delta [Liquorilactobacillus nagelii]|jgi:F-type H+-transporting ATPase subunit delta|uniref:ATP synthase F1 subunit delta n=1 Tax=Liquorilactobacillus nagelii TaxID=82688 RepID=UPI00242CDD60|nr:ATP synthase F1 subunit delta [Liquorilactobacillus nagelii]MCI1633010.1 F0F1 ATP synthase subunit delta [Liquorilactobacillus nagelii]MCI1921214.1 F0F1 ATP synthase subunit delta [Liquorilactobacillus nagelii]MCI1975907.1 F0F1 ATP synthase subunit delta [Liquorilactobacillus nagelii]
MKLNKATVVRRYGQALFSLAEEKQQRTKLLAELAELKTLLAGNPDLIKVLLSKQVSYQEKKAVLDIIIKAASPLTANLLRMLFDYNRIKDLSAIIDEYIRLNDQYEKTVHARVTTAIALDDAQKEKLAASFARVVGADKVILEDQVDPSIMGGVVLKSNNYIYDGSLRFKLAKIKRLLLK